MPVDGGGNITRPASPIPVTGQGADAPQVNVPIDDIYNALNMLTFLDGRKPLRGNINMNGYKAINAGNATAPQDYVPLAQVEQMIAAVSFIFPGFQMVDTVTSTAAPAGWLYANGQEVSRAAYPALWARVSAGNNLAATQGAKTHGQYGPGNGTTTFTLPNLYADEGYFIRPISSGRGIGTVQLDEIKSHNHTATFSGNAVPPHTHLYDSFPGGPGFSFGGGTVNAQPGSTGSAGGHTPSGTVSVQPFGGAETRPRNIAYPVLIKI